ncbi:MAG: dipeptidase [Pseudomonadota bacterium]
MTLQPVFDGHNDLLLHLWREGDLSAATFIEGRETGHIDLAKAKSGGFAGGFFAVFVPNFLPRHIATGSTADGKVENLPPIAAVDPAQARIATFEITAVLLRLARSHPEILSICRAAGDIDRARARGAIAAILHLEGAEGIGPDLAELEILHAAGLRSLGPVWSRPNIFGAGVPFRFPSTPDTGPGLTDAGRRLVAECNSMGIMVDLSHLNEAGFWDVAAISDAPLVATHSNVHALCASSRNLTDRQLDAIAERSGIVGLNFAVGFLRDDGRRISETPLETALRHIDHLMARLGEDGVALGSDFDGALVPRAIGTAAGLPALVAAMQDAGYGPDLIDRICWRNWVRFVDRQFAGG